MFRLLFVCSVCSRFFVSRMVCSSVCIACMCPWHEGFLAIPRDLHTGENQFPRTLTRHREVRRGPRWRSQARDSPRRQEQQPRHLSSHRRTPALLARNHHHEQTSCSATSRRRSRPGSTGQRWPSGSGGGSLPCATRMTWWTSWRGCGSSPRSRRSSSRRGVASVACCSATGAQFPSCRS